MATKSFPLAAFVQQEPEASTPRARLAARHFGLLSRFQVGLLTSYRALILVSRLLIGGCYFVQMWLLAKVKLQAVTPLQRAEWMHFCGRTILAAIGVQFRVEGLPPKDGTLIVANHLSYLDIAAFSAVLPCAFIAKHEIADWPLFGTLARFGGALFVNRDSRLHAVAAMAEAHARLMANVPVLLFPEGTSTDGVVVERFHSTLFEAAVRAGVPIKPASISYEPGSSDRTEQDLCWFGETLFVPHLRGVLGSKSFTAVIRFGESETHPDRKAAAWRCHEAVDAMRRSTRIDTRND